MLFAHLQLLSNADWNKSQQKLKRNTFLLWPLLKRHEPRKLLETRFKGLERGLKNYIDQNRLERFWTSARKIVQEIKKMYRTKVHRPFQSNTFLYFAHFEQETSSVMRQTKHKF